MQRAPKEQAGRQGWHAMYRGTMGGAWINFLGSPGTEITSDSIYMFPLYTPPPPPSSSAPALQATRPASLSFKLLPGQERLEAAPTGIAAQSRWTLRSWL